MISALSLEPGNTANCTGTDFAARTGVPCAGPETVVRYDFTSVPSCDMCGSERRRLIGLRLNGSTGLRPRRASGVAVPVKKCLDCGLVYCDPRPTPVMLEDHYEMRAEDYFDASQLHDWDAFDNSVLNGLIDVRPGMKIVDVGAGVGANMIAFKKAGWDAWGVEPSASFVRYGVERLGLDSRQLLQQSFEHTDLPSDTFDVVNFSSVLEHLASPAAALVSACRIVKPGGLIMAGVPSSGSLLARLLNLYYRLNGTQYVTNISPMHPPYHLYEFTHRSFIENGKRLGYELARHQYWTPKIFNMPAKLEPVVKAMLGSGSMNDGLNVYLRRL
jgi:SAM-dependent methyltransferase